MSNNEVRKYIPDIYKNQMMKHRKLGKTMDKNENEIQEKIL